MWQSKIYFGFVRYEAWESLKFGQIFIDQGCYRPGLGWAWIIRTFNKRKTSSVFLI